MSSSPKARSHALNDEVSAHSMRKSLPPGFFGTVQISASKRQEFCDIVQRRVKTLLADERSDKDLQVETKWKVFRRTGELKVYQRRLRGRLRHEAAAEEEFPEMALAVERGYPSMRVKGTLRGGIENMLYAFSANTQEDLLTGLSMTAPMQDAALLSVVEKSTDQDPLRSAEVIWLLTNLPILHPRDVCYLKATGSGIDQQGRRYGYMVLHSVDLPECPPFDYRRTRMLRAKMFFSFLFRESTPGCLKVTGRGVFDLDGGELLKLVLPHATSAMIDAILRGGSCSEAKKLTLLALSHANERSQVEVLTKKSVCSMCIRRNQSLIPGARLRLCDGCGVPVCKRCRIKDKRIFLGMKRPSRSAVCCMTCANQSKELTGVRLGAPEFLVEAEFFCKPRSKSCYSSSSRSIAAATPSALSLDTSVSDDKGQSFDSKPMRLSDPRPHDSSVDMTSSSLDDSVASCDLEVSFSDSLSDDIGGQSDEWGRVRPLGPVLCAKVMENDAEMCESEAIVVSSWSDKNHVSAWRDKNSGSAWRDKDRASTGKFIVTNGMPSMQRPNCMLEWMKELQSSADLAYRTAKANKVLMEKSRR